MAVFLYQAGEIKMALIKIEDLYFRYEQEQDWVLKGIDLEIDKGEFVVVVGHNGSGKSTLAQMLNGLLIPSRGRVKIGSYDTRESEDIWSIRQKVGMVFQNPDNQLVANIVEEDVAFGPENLGIESAEIRKRVKQALKKVDMLDYSRYAPHNLSGGQKQRVAIAGILAMQPECLVLDEPTAMLDPVGRESVIETIKTLNQQLDMTVVHITHFMMEAINADRIIVMEEGEIVLSGSPKELFRQVDKIREYNLDVPQVTELAFRLNQAGLEITPNNLNVDRLVEEICQLKSKI